MASELDRLLTVNEVAAKAAVSPKTVRREIERGALLASRLGRCLRITPDAYSAWVARGRVSRDAKAEAFRPPSPPAEVGSLARLRAIEGRPA